MSQPDNRTFREIWIEPWFRMASFVLGVWFTLACLLAAFVLAALASKYGIPAP